MRRSRPRWLRGLLCLILTAAGADAGGQETAPAGETEAVRAQSGEPELFKDGKLDIDAAVAYFDNLYRSGSSISDVELTVIRPHQERTLHTKTWTKGTDNALIEIQDPPRERGTITLKVDKNLWNYLPKVKRTIRIPPSMMLASWMGSDFTNDDLVRESSYKDDYTFELVGPSEDPAGWIIRFTARPDLVGLWDRFDVVISQDGRIPIKAEYFDRKGRLARTMEWDDVKVLGGRRLPARMTLTPMDKQGYKTVILYHDIEFDVDVPDSTFSLSNLERER